MEKLSCAAPDQSNGHADRDVGLLVERPRTATRADILDRAAIACPTFSRGHMRDVLETILDELSAALIRGDVVKLRGFGLFAVRAKAERVGRNPRTGVEVPITPRRVLTFKASPVLVDLLNGSSPSRTLAAAGADHEPSWPPR